LGVNGGGEDKGDNGWEILVDNDGLGAEMDREGMDIVFDIELERDSELVPSSWRVGVRGGRELLGTDGREILDIPDCRNEHSLDLVDVPVGVSLPTSEEREPW